ncbi:MAG: AraC family transcriptional regulator [Verrucomicrobiaceae bacterium]|nr:MAG: AraC family transcriptional regulator [Verrucomicrobiaceae bacterium]
MANELAEALLNYTDRQTGQSPFLTPIERLAIFRTDHPKPPNHMIMKPAMCIVAQGAKWAMFGDTKLEYRAGQALVLGVETPTIGRVVQASSDKPCLVLAFELDLAIMRSVAEGLETLQAPSGEWGRGVFVTDYQGPLADCAMRLVRLLDTPAAIPTLHPIIMREICYWLLTGPHGGDIAAMALNNSSSQPVIRAMHSLRKRFRESIRIDELAEIAGMSSSAFHRHFKALTSLTPLQYQKKLRLLEARRLMASRAYNVEAAAFEVGYESPSQFSREYARTFGFPPKKDQQQLQTRIRADRSHDQPSALRGAA